MTGNSFTIGQDLPAVSNPPQYSLAVAGGLNFQNYMNVNNGYSVEYAGSLGSNAHFNFNGGGSLYHDTTGDLATAQSSLYSQVTSASSSFSAMATTGTTSIVGGNTLTFKYTGNSGGVAVFNVSASMLNSGSVQDLNLLLNGASSDGHQCHGTAVVELQPDQRLAHLGRGVRRRGGVEDHLELRDPGRDAVDLDAVLRLDHRARRELHQQHRRQWLDGV